jgi:hypothetical protein
VIAFLREHAEKRELPILRMLETLAEGHVDSVSFTRDAPYFRFYASSNSKGAIITMNTDKGEFETTVDLSRLSELFHQPTLRRPSGCDRTLAPNGR